MNPHDLLSLTLTGCVALLPTTTPPTSEGMS